MRLSRSAFLPNLFVLPLAVCLAWPSTAPAQTTEPAAAQEPAPGVPASGESVLEEAPADAVALMEAAVRLAESDQPAAALDRAEEAYFAVWERLPLGFRQTELVAERPEAYGRVQPRETNAYDPGEQISIYVDPIGFGWREVGNGWETDLAADFILATPEGRIIAGQKEFGEFRIRSAQRDPDSFLMIDYKFNGVPPGDYVLTTTMHDRIEDESASFETPISIE